MITKVMKNRWIEFKCDMCEKPLHIKLGICKEVICSCGCLHDLKKVTGKLSGRQKTYNHYYQ